MKRCTILFLPDKREVEVAAGTTVLQAAARAGIELKTVCGGEGTCGQCAVSIVEGEAEVGQGNMPRKYREAGYVLACRTKALSDLVVEVPDETRVTEQQVLLEEIDRGEVLVEAEPDVLGEYSFQPLARKVALTLEEPTLTENASDLTRLLAALNKQAGVAEVRVGLGVLRRLPEVLREGNWRVTVTLAEHEERAEVVAVEPGPSRTPPYGLAVDVGTTTIVVALVNLETGATVDRRGSYNRQFRFGDDVITRIIHASQGPEELRELQSAALETINALTGELLRANRLDREAVAVVFTAGNTTMAHLLLGIPPDFIRLEPYIPAAARFPVVRAGELGLEVNPEAPVLSFPAVASYVGGDIVSGVLVSGAAEAEPVSLFIDIGTNGEIVLGNRDWLVACACSAGPCFEGGGITFGTRATPGAIQRVEIDEDYEVRVETVGGAKPIGICGSGLVDCLAKLLAAGIIDRAGRFQEVDTPRRRDSDDGPEFVLVWQEEAATDGDIVITESDVKNLLRAKGAIYAGIRSLLKTVELPEEAIERIYIAGGFGNYLNIKDAVEIGLLPDLPREKYVFIGNASVKGARMALLSREALRGAEEVARKMTYLELSAGNMFMEEFTSAMFLPHTDLSLFPSVRGTAGREGR